MGRTLGTGVSAAAAGCRARPLQAPYGSRWWAATRWWPARHMHEYGTIRSSWRDRGGRARYAGLNPKARIATRSRCRTSSRAAWWPTAAQARLLRGERRRRRLPHDHGRARARLRQPAVRVLGPPAGRRTGTSPDAGLHDVGGREVHPRGARARGRETFRDRHAPVLRQLHHHVLVLLEDAGFCKKGEGGAYVQQGHCGAADAIRSTPTAAGSRRSTPACAGSS